MSDKHTTYSMPSQLPDLTLESLTRTVGDLKKKLAEPFVNGTPQVVSSEWMPDGFWAMTGHNSVYLMTPNGPVSWKTDWLGRVIETNPPDLLEKVQDILQAK